MKLKFGLVVAALAVLAFGWVGGGTTTQASETSATTVLKIKLRGPEISEVVPWGTFQYVQTSSDTRIFVNVSRVQLTEGTVLSVWVNSTKIGTMTLNASHRGRLVLSVRRGDTVPAVTGEDQVRVRNGATVSSPAILVIPTDPQFFYMYAKMQGDPIEGRMPIARATYRETEFGYARTLRLFMQSVNMVGEELTVYKGIDPETDVAFGTCTVTAAKQCLIKLVIHDDDPVTNLTTAHSIRVRDSEDNVILTHSGWTQVVPRP